jgi:NTP pyrophosphatase (non-canonical NTP hydrolase)
MSFGPCSCEITLGGGCGCSPPSSLTLKQYQEGALNTDTTSNFEWDYYAVAVAGEAGEILEHVKKNLRDDGGELTEERREKIIKEMGDVLWYLAVCADRLDVGLDEVAQINLDKLAARKENGTLHGDGDDR